MNQQLMSANSDFNPGEIYSLAEPVPGSNANEFYIKVTGAGGPEGAQAGYFFEKSHSRLTKRSFTGFAITSTRSVSNSRRSLQAQPTLIMRILPRPS